MKDITIKVMGGLWKVWNDKCSMLSLSRVSYVFEPSVTAKAAFEKLLGMCLPHYQKEFPDAKALDWSIISVHFHESQSRSFSLDHFDKKRPISELFEECVRQKLLAELKAADRTLEVRFVFHINDIMPDEDMLASYISGLKSKVRPQQSGFKATLASKRKLDSQATPPASASKHLASVRQPRSSAGPIRLKSAFALPLAVHTPVVTGQPSVHQSWSRNPRMVPAKFVQTMAEFTETCHVNWKATGSEETIYLPSDLGKSQENEGYIGHGYSKFAFYARFEGTEYAITQPCDPNLSDASVKHLLQAEFGLLCQCDGFKKIFDDYAELIEPGMSEAIPDFYFNFPKSIFGRFITTPETKLHMPHKYFVATPLLPCGKLDPKIIKFTGNNGMNTPSSNIMRAVHAFTHFSWIYSRGHIVFCDLQGAEDDGGRWCLIDPQVHTNVEDAEKRNEYWDLGPKYVKKFIKEHAADCGSNWVCNYLGLRTLVLDESGDLAEAASNVNRSSAVQPSRSSSINLNSSAGAGEAAPARKRVRNDR
ncbi:hypothetical protein MD484_g837, partial [Candolleomyces efflorescens]